MDSKGAGVLDSFVGALAGAIVDVGRAGLHVLGPDNFEYYMCSLSLRDKNMKEVAYMSFPVMPNNIMESKQAIASVTKTNKGIVTQFNSSFNPVDISLQGTFGRKLRLILGNKEFVPEATASFAMAQKFFNGNIGINGGIAGTDILIKTGYGLTKMMEHILDAAYLGDDNGPYIVVFTNYAFNTSYIVEPLQRSFSQSTENNMIWYYNVEMKAVADWSQFSANKANIGKFMGQVAANAVSSVLTKVLNSAMRLIAL